MTVLRIHLQVDVVHLPLDTNTTQKTGAQHDKHIDVQRV